MKRNLRELETIIHYEFNDFSLAEQSMMHRSFTNEKHLHKKCSNERMEFLGDAVLELISSEFLFRHHPDMLEGQLTKLRASLVCEPALAYCAREIKLGSFLRLGKGEDVNGGRERESLISDALEALIGAIYIDGGFANAKEFVMNFVLNDIEHKKLFFDSKTILQEKIQGASGGKIEYRLVRAEGPDHQKNFIVEVYIDDTCLGQGEGRSKKVAEQNAAYNAMVKIAAGKSDQGGLCI